MPPKQSTTASGKPAATTNPQGSATKQTRATTTASAASPPPAAPAPTTIDEYIAPYPASVREVLERVRQTVQRAAPDAVERISYRMPSFEQLGALVYFGGFKEHIGFYPPVRDPALREAAAPYMNEKGNLQFRLDAPIPYDLITRLVEARVRENTLRHPASTAKRRKTP